MVYQILIHLYTNFIFILCQFTRTDEAIKKRLEYTGYETIRPNQEKVVRNYLEGKDVLFCSPTGSGKILTFELASFFFKCTDQSAPASMIVVSPLAALTQFQVETFRKKNINAVYLGDLESQYQSATLLDDISKGLFDVMFASPEPLLGHYRSPVTGLKQDKQKSPGRATSRSRSQPPTPGGRE